MNDHKNKHVKLDLSYTWKMALQTVKTRFMLSVVSKEVHQGYEHVTVQNWRTQHQ